MGNTKTWQTLLAGEKQQPYFQAILNFLKNEKAKGKIIYPKFHDIFNALKYTPFQNVRVVIIGQDPYHGANQAHGLCFSVQKGIAPPPSLKNIFKEMHHDLGVTIPKHGNLEKWAQQGVLLLNTILTVEAGLPHSHAQIGWATFTDRVICALNNEKRDLIFLLWGAPAQKKGELIDAGKHFILTAPHPSPFSANRGFFGCKHFSKTNALLKKTGNVAIDWAL